MAVTISVETCSLAESNELMLSSNKVVDIVIKYFNSRVVALKIGK